MLSVICVLILPLIPILYEMIRGRQIGTADLMLTASMYAIGVGVSSSSRLTFLLAIFIGIIHAANYGEFKAVPDPSPRSELLAYISISFVFLIHTVERYNIHVVELKLWEFPGGGK